MTAPKQPTLPTRRAAWPQPSPADDLARLREWTTSEGYAALVAATPGMHPRFDARDRAALRRVVASVVDLRDRVALLAVGACFACKCAPRRFYEATMCNDCRVSLSWPRNGENDEQIAAACISVGLRALCGRRLG